MGARPILLSNDTPSTIRSTQPPKPVDEGEGQRKKERQRDKYVIKADI